ncbi:MAG: hypothetical protein KatS3mg080_0173 [Anoxybacillus sp.]|nr:MAG: hypothetical protein KatS3mg080_0173 [Anoxybacillus sp.]
MTVVSSKTIGTYNPLTEPAEVKINEELALKWLQNGAKPSDTVRNFAFKTRNFRKIPQLKVRKVMYENVA